MRGARKNQIDGISNYNIITLLENIHLRKKLIFFIP